MASHRQKLEWWDDYRCDRSQLVALNVNGRYPVRVAAPIEPAVRALEHAIVSNGYQSPMDATGSYLCRTIAGTSTMSLHAYGIAIDWDYPNNPVLPYRLERGFGTDARIRLTETQIDAVERIVNDVGDPIWKWLGWRTPRADPMHFEIDVPPRRCFPADLKGPSMPIEQWEQMIDALFAGSPEFQGDPDYWKTLDPDSPEWADFWAAFVRHIGG